MYDAADLPDPDTDDLQAADAALLTDLDDPVAGVVAAGLSRQFVQLCMCAAEPVVADLVRQEPMLRKPGGTELAGRIISRRLYHRFDPQVFGMLRVCVQLAHAESAFTRMEEMLRSHLAQIVTTAASYLLTDGRDAAIHMMTVATTMAAREVADSTAGIIADSHLIDED